MEYLNKEPDKLVEIFIDKVLATNRGFNYYVDWDNINGYQEFLIEIHAMDVLIRCNDETFFDKFSTLVNKLPTVILLFPYLFGLAKNERNNLYNGRENLIIIQDELGKEDHWKYNFSRKLNCLTNEDIRVYYDFFVKIGLKYLYQNIIEKSTLDYIVGVLVGMDSNGRKNRGGRAFELACQPILEKVCEEHQLKLLSQKKFKTLRQYGFNISEDIANRKADFIILDVNRKKAINFEVNFFNDTGSKPEEIIDSYINRQKDLLSDGIKFALVTDGKCWKSATNQLNKGFKYLDYLMNFYLLKHGMLEEILLKVFSKND